MTAALQTSSVPPPRQRLLQRIMGHRLVSREQYRKALCICVFGIKSFPPAHPTECTVVTIAIEYDYVSLKVLPQKVSHSRCTDPSFVVQRLQFSLFKRLAPTVQLPALAHPGCRGSPCRQVRSHCFSIMEQYWAMERQACQGSLLCNVLELRIRLPASGTDRGHNNTIELQDDFATLLFVLQQSIPLELALTTCKRL